METSTESVLLALDIGAKKHAFAWEHGDHREAGTVDNTPAALRTFLTQLVRRAGGLRVLMEATGVYYLDVALMATELGAQVSVVNPRATHNFSKAMQQRNKTDRLDAAMLLDFLKRMPFTAWTAPRQPLLELRSYGRYLAQLTKEKTAANNRLHALVSTHASPAYLRADLKRFIAALERRIDRIREHAVALIKTDAPMQVSFDALVSAIGVADTSAVSLLSELMVLPRTMSGRACVCHAGLDPQVFESGTSVHKAPRISRHGNRYLRAALYFPAMTASERDPLAKAFKQRLIDRGKQPMQAIVAIMRKLLTAFWAMIRHLQPFDTRKLYFTPKTA
jgi:transposase